MPGPVQSDRKHTPNARFALIVLELPWLDLITSRNQTLLCPTLGFVAEYWRDSVLVKDIQAQWAKIRQGLDICRISSKCVYLSNGEV